MKEPSADLEQEKTAATDLVTRIGRGDKRAEAEMIQRTAGVCCMYCVVMPGKSNWHKISGKKPFALPSKNYGSLN